MRTPGHGLRYVPREPASEFVPKGEAPSLLVAPGAAADLLPGGVRIDPAVIAQLERLEAKLDRLIAWIDAAEE